jgi:hypothetical protein
MESEAAARPADAARPGQRWLIGGGALLLVAISMPWYVAERGGDTMDTMTFSWQWVPVLVVVLLLDVLLALVVAFRAPPPGGGARPWNLLGLVIACVGLVWTAFRLWLPPEYVTGLATANVHPSLGPWFATAACFLILRGQWLAAGFPPGRLPSRGSRPQA